MSRGRTEPTSYFSLTAGGALLALRLRDRFGGTAHLPRCHSIGCSRCSPFDSLTEVMPERFAAGDTIVAVMAAGIVFRLLAPYLTSKRRDPAVIVVDEEGRHVIPLLGGHAAGANALSLKIAEFLQGEAAITTSSDVQGLVGPDEVARLLDCRVDDEDSLRQVTSLLVDGHPVCLESASDPRISGYEWISPGADAGPFAARLLIRSDTPVPESVDASRTAPPTAVLIPRNLYVGVGCKRGTSAPDILEAIEQACEATGADIRAVNTLASVAAKADESGIHEAARQLGCEEPVFYPPPRMAALGRPGNRFVAEKVGTPAVAEPAALLAAAGARPLDMAGDRAAAAETKISSLSQAAHASPLLILPKTAYGAVTIALALRPAGLRPAASRSAMPEPAGLRPAVAEAPRQGRVLVVGTGAGTRDLLTDEAAAAIEGADVVIGYRTYIDQLRAVFPTKEFVTGSMGREVDRCREALDLARRGRTVAMVSSGDPGIYGMAGPLLEMADGVTVEVLPGVTAAQIAAARLGAPLMNDFVTISLSDLLTPREEVLRRITAAAASDLVVCLYNPTSRKRRPLFEEACAILLSHRDPETPVGWVRDAGGPAEDMRIITLGHLLDQDTDMRTMIVIGNTRTEIVGGRMVTRRGYRRES